MNGKGKKTVDFIGFKTAYNHGKIISGTISTDWWLSRNAIELFNGQLAKTSSASFKGKIT